MTVGSRHGSGTNPDALLAADSMQAVGNRLHAPIGSTRESAQRGNGGLANSPRPKGIAGTRGRRTD